MTPGYAKSRAELPHLYYPECDKTMIINSHNFGGGLLLDEHLGATAAYSLRKLRTAYAGSSIRVRRSSDNAEQDIGFDGTGFLDIAALLAFCAAGDGLITKLYDQQNSNDQVQSTPGTQPKIVSAGSLITSNGRAAWSDVGGLGFSSVAISEATAYSLFVVQQLQDTNANFGPRWFDFRNGGQGHICKTSSTNTIYTADYGVDMSGLSINFAGMFSQTLASSCGSGASSGSNTGSFDFRVNGSILESSFSSRSAVIVDLGGKTGTNMFNAAASIGLRQELIFFSSDKSGSQSEIEEDMNNFWDVY